MNAIEGTQTLAAEPRAAHPRRRTGHIGRITALSMAAGAVTSVILALGVFGGATEPVLTGAVLMAFAGSWWLYATLARRRTEQPQQWARVPAVTMAAVGVALLVFRPDDAQMDVAGWVWPGGLVALAVWMVVQSRRSLHSWSRRVVLYPIFGLMIVGGIGAAYEAVREAQDHATYAMPGDLVDVGGHRLHISCVGTGSPTVVLEAGLGEPSTIMAGWIAPAVSPTTRVCVYDRAGKGWSDPAPADADALAGITDLHALLVNHGEHGPFVLAGHSSGGVYVQAYAATYPDDVAGLVLIDSQPRTALTDLPGYSGDHAALRKASGIAQPGARFGLMRLLSNVSSGTLPDTVRAQERAFGSTAGQARSMRDELVALPSLMERAQALDTVGDEPVEIVTAEQDAMQGWLPLQAALKGLSTNSSQHSVPDATHASLVDDEHDAVSSSRAILDVVQSIRTGSATATPTPSIAGNDPPATVRPTTPVDQLVDVNGARLHVRCDGIGSVTTVLIAGFETGSDIWSAVTPALARQTRVCTYDRYGTGTSDPAPTTQTFATQADDLHAALVSLGEPGPYIVVGHSFGGSEAVTFAARHRTEITALALVDASPTTWPATLCAVGSDETPAAAGYQQLCSNVSTPARNAERLDGVAAFDEVAKIDTLDDLPIVVMTAAHHPWGLADDAAGRLDDVWRAGQQHWLTLSPNARLVTVDGTGHNIQVDRPAAVIEQVAQLTG